MRDVKVKYEKINVVLLHSGLAYQRKVTDMKRVKDIATNWDKKLFQNPCVSLREGMYNVIDGQHTIAAYKMRFGEKSEIVCKVAYGLTQEEESEWFYDETKKGRKQSLNTIYNARLQAKDDKLISIIEDLKQTGLMLQINVPSGKCVIKALKRIEEIHDEMNNIDFIACFKLLHDTWNGDTDSLKEAFIKGIVKFYNTYKGEFDTNRFITALANSSPKNIKSEADNDMYAKDKAISYARIMAEKYNYKLRKIPTLNVGKLLI